MKFFLRKSDLPLNIFLFLAIYTVSGQLVRTDWTSDLNIVRTVTFWGFAFGLVLGLSRLKRVPVFIISLGYGVLILVWQLARMSPNGEFLTRIYRVGVRLWQTILELASSSVVNDHVFFVTVMAIIFWGTALYSSYTLNRHENILGAVIAPTLIILTIQFYDVEQKKQVVGLGFYFFFLFAFLGRYYYLHEKKDWVAKNIFFDADSLLNVSIARTLVIGGLIFFAWNVPVPQPEVGDLSYSEAPVRSLQDFFNNALAAIDESPVKDSQSIYPSRMALGSSTYQSEQVLFTVRNLDGERFVQRYYWKLRVYDTYFDGYWSNASLGQGVDIPAGERISVPVNTYSATQNFLFYNNIERQSLVLYIQQPTLINMDINLSYSSVDSNNADIYHIKASPPLKEDESYLLEANLIAPTVTQLRDAGTAYPDWVLERYLQLPSNFSPRIYALAEEITSDHESPYDKAQAITDYLRRSISYAPFLPSPPSNEEPLEWFLFSYKEGFCNYSASAEVILLRAAGIPARMVVGFSQGQRNEAGDFVIQQRDAHAWPEVYFPNIGWVEFEPTGNQNRLVRPLGEPEIQGEIDKVLQSGILEDGELSEQETDVFGELDESADAEKGPSALVFWGIIVMALSAVLFGIWRLDRNQTYLTRALHQVVRRYERNERRIPKWIVRWLAWLEARDMERAFHAINRALKWLKGEIPRHLTPLERAEMLKEILPEESDAIMQLLHEHEKTLFTSAEGDVEIARNASKRITRAALEKRLRRSDKAGS